jgi:hypothetical protein
VIQNGSPHFLAIANQGLILLNGDALLRVQELARPYR